MRRLVADVSWSNLQRSLVVGESPDLPVMASMTTSRSVLKPGSRWWEWMSPMPRFPRRPVWLRETISFNKGCFLGQEFVARLDSRGGRVNHHLRILRFDGSAPEVATEVTKDGEQVGTVTSLGG